MDVEEQLKSYIGKIFGPIIGERLLKQNLKELGITNISSLNIKEQSDVMEKIITKIYEKHIEKSQIQEIVNEMKIKFATVNASEKISKRLGVDFRFKDFKIDEISKESIGEEFAEGMSAEKTAVVLLDIKGTVNGNVVAFVDSAMLLDYANIMTKILTGKESGSREYDDVTKSSVQELLNIILSETFTILNNIMNIQLSFVIDLSHIDKFDQFYTKFSGELPDKDVNKIFNVSALKMALRESQILTSNVLFLT